MLRARPHIPYGALLCLTVAGCTGHGGASGEPDVLPGESQDDLAWFRCQAAAGSHHNVVLIDRDDTPLTSSDDGEDSETVRIRFSTADDGVVGECGSQAGAAGAAPVFTCRANDQSVTITWPSNVTTGTVTTAVSEPWLLGTRHYTAACSAKK